MVLPEGRCQVCGSPCSAMCTTCYQVRYCGQEHQKQDWKRHKVTCKKQWRIKESPEAGRYMIASRDVEPGDVILRELPILAGPNVSTGSKPVCVECLKPVSSTTFVACSKCRLPLCSESCGNSASHTQGLCKVFQSKPDVFYGDQKGASKQPNLKHAQYQLVLPIKVLILKRTDVHKYKQFMALQSHREERKGGPLEQRVNQQVVEPLKHLLQHQGQTDPELVHEICGIFDTNGFDLKSGNEVGVDLTGVFSNASMMMHSCRKNVRVTFRYRKNHQMTIMAAEHISAGAIIFYSYTEVFMTTNLRRLMLFTGKLFSCECKRCSDPTEFGSNSSAMLCTICNEDKSVILPESPLDIQSSWICLGCHCQHSGLEMASRERAISTQMEEELEMNDVEQLEEFIRNNSKILHHKNGLMMKAKLSLSVAYGRMSGQDLMSLSQKKLERKVELCKEVLGQLQILEAPLATRIGLASFELATALFNLAERKKKDDETKLILKQCLGLFGKAHEILIHEAPDSDCAMLAKEAAKQRDLLQ